MNLVLHACAVVPDGGRLLIQTSRTEAPQHGALASFASFRMTYAATEPDLDRLFDPAGSGQNGLALSVAHSIAAEHGGYLTARAVTEGTRIELLLPRVNEESRSARSRARRGTSPHRSAGGWPGPRPCATAQILRIRGLQFARGVRPRRSIGARPGARGSPRPADRRCRGSRRDPERTSSPAPRPGLPDHGGSAGIVTAGNPPPVYAAGAPGAHRSSSRAQGSAAGPRSRSRFRPSSVYFFRGGSGFVSGPGTANKLSVSSWFTVTDSEKIS